MRSGSSPRTPSVLPACGSCARSSKPAATRPTKHSTGREAGYSDEEILEMVANVALTTFSNYTNDLALTELDLPEVERVHG